MNTVLDRIARACALVLAASLLANTSFAQTVTGLSCAYTGVSGGQWNVPTNWGGGCGGSIVPGANDVANISAVTVVLPAGLTTVGDLVLSNSSIKGPTTGSASATLDVKLVGGTGPWLPSGTYTFQDMTLQLDGANTVFAFAPMILTNAQLVLTASTKVNVMGITATGATGGVIINSGTRLISGGAGDIDMQTGSNFALAPGGHFEVAFPSIILSGSVTNDGGIVVNTGNTLTLAAAAQYTQANGSLLGDGAVSAVGQVLTTNGGTVEGNLTLNVGTLHIVGGSLTPNSSAIGTVTVNGNLIMDASASVNLDLTNPLAPVRDVFNVSGTLTLNSTVLNVTYLGYAPVVNDTFTVVNFGGRVGTFGSATVIAGGSNPVTVNYLANSLQVVVAPLAALTITPAAINIVATPIGWVRGGFVNVLNSSAATVTVSSFGVSGAPSLGTSNTGPDISCPNTINVGGNCGYGTGFSPTAVGPVTGSLALNTSLGTFNVPITAIGVAAIPPPTASVSSLSFPPTAIGGTSPAQTITFTNPLAGLASVNVPNGYFYQAGDSTSFTLQSSTCGGLLSAGPPLAAGASCTLTIAFTPQGPAGAKAVPISVQFTSPTDTYGLQYNIPLIGSATAAGAPAVTVAGTTIFTNTLVSLASGVQPITITNSGTGPLTISSIAHNLPTAFPDTTGGPAPNVLHYCGFGSVAGGAPNTGTPIVIAAGASCVLNLIFTPTSPGSFNGTITLNSNAATSPTVINLSGTGVSPPATFSPAGLLFGNVPITVSVPQVVTFTNTSSVAYNILSVVDSAPGYFASVGSGATPCAAGLMLAADASCTYTTTYTAGGTGSANNVLTISFTPGASATTITQTQTGNGAGFLMPATVSPVSFAFGNLVIGSTQMNSFTFTNNSNTTMYPTAYTLTGVSTTGLFFTGVGSGGTPCTVGLMLAPGTSCGYTLTVTPTGSGASNATTSIGWLAGLGTNPAYTTAQGASVNGIAATPTPNMTVAFSPPTVVAGTASTLVVTITNPAAVGTTLGGSSVSTTAPLNISGAVTNTCALSGGVTANTYSFGMATILPGGTCTINIPVLSTIAGSFTVNVVPGNLVSLPAGNNTNSSSAILTVTAIATGPFAYIANFGGFSGTTVTAIDLPTNTVAATIPVGTGPVGATVNFAGTRVYVANQQSNSVSVINTATNTVIATVPVGSQPASIGVNPAGTRAYVPNQTSNSVSVIDTTTNTVIATVSPLTLPSAAVVNPSGTKAYVNQSSANLVSAIDTTTNTVLGSVAVCSGPYQQVVNATGTRLYVVCSSGNVSVIDTSTFTVIATIPVGATARGIAITPNGSRVWTSNSGSNNVSIIDTATNTVIATVAAGTTPWGVAGNAAGTRMYVVNNGSNNVSVFDTATNSIVATVPTGAGPLTIGQFLQPGAVAANPLVSLSPATVPFGARTIMTTSPASSVTLTNSGTAPLVISNIASTGDFGFTSTCPILTPPVNAGAACNISVTFTPLTAGALVGTVTITSNAPGSPHVINLTGTGAGVAVAGIALSATTLGFGGTVAGMTSAPASITVANSGFATLNLTSITVSGTGFARATPATGTPPNCGASLAPGTNCQIAITFSPNAIAAFTGALNIANNSGGGTVLSVVTLSGSGIALPISVISVAGSIGFGDQVIATSGTQALTIANTGNALLSVSVVAISGANAANFTQSGSCVTVAAGAGCVINLTFLPTTAGAKTATVTITSDSGGNTGTVSTVSLTGNAVLAQRPIAKLSLTAMGFGNNIFGGATPNQVVTLENTGGVAMSVASILTVGDFGQMNNCGNTLASSASCTINILFGPLAVGTRVGELQVFTNADGSPHRVQLSGTGCRWFSQVTSRFFLTSCGN